MSNGIKTLHRYMRLSNEKELRDNDDLDLLLKFHVKDKAAMTKATLDCKDRSVHAANARDRRQNTKGN
jgi:hypothetical protein